MSDDQILAHLLIIMDDFEKESNRIDLRDNLSDLVSYLSDSADKK